MRAAQVAPYVLYWPGDGFLGRQFRSMALFRFARSQNPHDEQPSDTRKYDLYFFDIFSIFDGRPDGTARNRKVVIQEAEDELRSKYGEGFNKEIFEEVCCEIEKEFCL